MCRLVRGIESAPKSVPVVQRTFQMEITYVEKVYNGSDEDKNGYEKRPFRWPNDSRAQYTHLAALLLLLSGHCSRSMKSNKIREMMKTNFPQCPRNHLLAHETSSDSKFPAHQPRLGALAACQHRWQQRCPPASDCRQSPSRHWHLALGPMLMAHQGSRAHCRHGGSDG